MSERNTQTEETNREESSQRTTRPGMDAISEALARLYPGQEGRYYGLVLPAGKKGKDPLDGIEVWESGTEVPHWHYVTYGFSELDGKECGDPDNSGYGFELTFRLKKQGEEPPTWPMGMLERIAGYVFATGNGFSAGHYVDCGGPLTEDGETKLRALAFRTDPELGEMDTPNGHLAFLEAVAITGDEMDALMVWNGEKFLEQAEAFLPLGITDPGRDSLMKIPAFCSARQAGVEADGSSTSFLYMDELRAGLDGENGLLTLKAERGPEFARMLRARLGKGRPLYVESRDAVVSFLPGEEAQMEIQDGVAALTIPEAGLEELCRVLTEQRRSSQLEQLPLTVEMIPSETEHTAG